MTTDLSRRMDAYQKSVDNALSKIEIVLTLYRAMLRNIEGAKAAYIARDFEKMTQLNDKTIAILVALQSHIDHDKGGDAAKNLNTFYTSVYIRITSAMRRADVPAEYDYIHKNVKDVYTHWYNLFRKFPELFETAERNASPTDMV